MTKITATLHEDQYTFLIVYRSVLRMRNVSDKSCRENRNTRCIIKFYSHQLMHFSIQLYMSFKLY